MRNLCVIPARGGSKRIPGKNIKPFMGRPIMAYSIETALGAGVFDDVLVSTDDQRISEVALDHGATVPFFRPPELSDDHAGTNAVVRHAIGELARRGSTYEYVACIYATAPLLTSDVVRDGLSKLKESDAAFAVTVTSFPAPVHRAMRVDRDGRLSMLYPEHRETRSQDVPATYHDAGQLYWGRSEAFEAEIPLFGHSTTIPLPMPRHLVQDIDTPEDWIRAEALFQVMRSAQSSRP